MDSRVARDQSQVSAENRRRFFLAGVSKAGTTALYEFLGQHPQVFVCPIKEPSYFAASDFLALQHARARKTIDERARSVEQWLAGALPDIPADGFAFNWRAYEALFRNVRDELAVGEGSTTYWYAAGAARAIHERYPTACFVLVLRNPADRFFSQYLTTRWNTPLKSCREFFRMARERRQGWGLVLDMGRYATNLRRFFEFFPRARFSIHLYEDFCNDPRAVCREVFRFLGVDPGFPVDTTARINEPRLPRFPALHAARRSLPGLRALTGALPARWRDALRSAYLQPRVRVHMNVGDRRRIIDYYRDEILETAELIGRDLSPWLK